MEKLKIDFSKINLDKIREDVNLVLFNSGFGNIENMKETNKLIEGLKNVKLQITHS